MKGSPKWEKYPVGGTLKGISELRKAWIQIPSLSFKLWVPGMSSDLPKTQFSAPTNQRNNLWQPHGFT